MVSVERIVMRDHSHHICLTRDEAVAQMLAAIDALPAPFAGGTDYVSLSECFGRVLARDVRARADAPSCLTCKMDSIAVHWDDFAGGVPDVSGWQRGRNWDFANTGTAMPDGFDTAIVVEHVEFSDDSERVLAIDAAPSRQFAGTRPAGSSVKRGDLLVAAGTVVTPDVAARIASGNVASVPVVSKPRVAFIATGDELQTPGSPFLAHGKNFETNSYLARGKVEAWGGMFMGFQTIRDQFAAIKAAVLDAAQAADIVVLNAGSSKGSGDWSCEVLDEIGHVICHETNHGPGHHSSYAMVNGTPVVGISGPAGGASPTMDFYLRPLMRKFLGLDPVLPKLPAVLAADFSMGHGPGGPSRGDANKPLPGETPPRKEPPEGFYSIRFLNVALGEDGRLVATPVAGAPMSPQVMASNAYYMMPSGKEQAKPKAGDLIMVELRGR